MIKQEATTLKTPELLKSTTLSNDNEWLEKAKQAASMVVTQASSFFRIAASSNKDRASNHHNLSNNEVVERTVTAVIPLARMLSLDIDDQQNLVFVEKVAGILNLAFAKIEDDHKQSSNNPSNYSNLLSNRPALSKRSDSNSFCKAASFTNDAIPNNNVNIGSLIINKVGTQELPISDLLHIIKSFDLNCIDLFTKVNDIKMAPQVRKEALLSKVANINLQLVSDNNNLGKE